MLHALLAATITMLASAAVLRIGDPGAALYATDVVLGGLVIAMAQVIVARLLGSDPLPPAA